MNKNKNIALHCDEEVHQFLLRVSMARKKAGREDWGIRHLIREACIDWIECREDELLSLWENK